MEIVKSNVGEFNSDVEEHGGYKYSGQTSYSAEVANERLLKAATDMMLKTNPKSVIDIGCGDGYYTHQISTRFPKVEFTGIDPAEKAIHYAQKRFKQIQFSTGNALDPKSLPKTQFDLATLRGVLHHTADPFRAIANLEPIAERLLIIEPNGYNPVLKLIEKTSKYHREHEERSFPLYKLRRWCEDSGFNVVSCEFVGFVPFFFPKPIAKVIHAIQPWLEKLPIIKHIFSACYVIECERAKAYPDTYFKGPLSQLDN